MTTHEKILEVCVGLCMICNSATLSEFSVRLNMGIILICVHMKQLSIMCRCLDLSRDRGRGGWEWEFYLRVFVRVCAFVCISVCVCVLYVCASLCVCVFVCDRWSPGVSCGPGEQFNFISHFCSTRSKIIWISPSFVAGLACGSLGNHRNVSACLSVKIWKFPEISNLQYS